MTARWLFLKKFLSQKSNRKARLLLNRAPGWRISLHLAVQASSGKRKKCRFRGARALSAFLSWSLNHHLYSSLTCNRDNKHPSSELRIRSKDICRKASNQVRSNKSTVKLILCRTLSRRCSKHSSSSQRTIQKKRSRSTICPHVSPLQSWQTQKPVLKWQAVPILQTAPTVFSCPPRTFTQ